MIYTIDKKSPIPFYYQIEQSLIKALENGEWDVGEFIPSERELSEKFNVSRITIRKALGNLIGEGLLKKVKGRGTLVAEPRIEEHLFNKLIGVYEDLLEKGYKVTNKIIDFSKTTPEGFIAKYLNLNSTDEVFIIERLRFIGSEPYQHTMTYIPEKIFPNFDYRDLINGSLYKLFEEKYGLRIYRIRRIIEADIASTKDIELFKLKKCSSIMSFRNITYIKNNIPVEFSFNRIRGDRTRFEIELSSERVEELVHKYGN